MNGLCSRSTASEEQEEEMEPYFEDEVYDAMPPLTPMSITPKEPQEKMEAHFDTDDEQMLSLTSHFTTYKEQEEAMPPVFALMSTKINREDGVVQLDNDDIVDLMSTESNEDYGGNVYTLFT